MAPKQLVRELDFPAALSLTVGTIIGTGVFLKTAVMAQQVGSPGRTLLAWGCAGVLSLAGALVYAELGAMMPRAGGEYVFLKETYGDAVAFLYGWMRFAVGAAGSIAIYSVGCAIFLSGVVAYDSVWIQKTFHLFGSDLNWRFGTRQIVALVIIWLFSGLNCLGVALGGKTQTFLTTIKVGAIGAIVVGTFAFSNTGTFTNFVSATMSPMAGGAGAFGAAMLAALWAYDGWNNLPMAAGEVKNPERNIPRSLILGMAVVLAVYACANLAYFYALPFGEVVSANSTANPDAPPVATKAALTAFGLFGAKLVSAAFVLSSLGALNGSILTNARTPFAMARDGLFFPFFGKLNEKRVPAGAIVAQASWASVLAISGTFDQLTDYVVFASWLFYALAVTGVFILRKRLPDADRPYRTLGYPVTPLLFIFVALWLIVNTLRSSPVEAGLGLGIIALGVPILLFQKKFQRKDTKAQRHEGVE